MKEGKVEERVSAPGHLGRAAYFNAHALKAALAARLRQYPGVPSGVTLCEVLAVEGHEMPDDRTCNALRVSVALGRISPEASRYRILYEFSGRITLIDRTGPSRQYHSIQNELCIAEVLRRLANNHNLH